MDIFDLRANVAETIPVNEWQPLADEYLGEDDAMLTPGDPGYDEEAAAIEHDTMMFDDANEEKSLIVGLRNTLDRLSAVVAETR